MQRSEKSCGIALCGDVVDVMLMWNRLEKCVNLFSHYTRFDSRDLVSHDTQHFQDIHRDSVIVGAFL